MHLSRDLMAIAGGSLKANITTLGPLVLPYSEQLLFFFNLCVNLFVTKVRRIEGTQQTAAGTTGSTSVRSTFVCLPLLPHEAGATLIPRFKVSSVTRTGACPQEAAAIHPRL